MTILVRSAGLTGFEELAAGCGIDAAKSVQRAGLTLKALRDPDALIPYVAVMQLLERAARDSGRPDFGQQLSLRQGLPILGPIAVLMKHVPTVGEAFRLATRYIFVHSPAIRFAVEAVAGRADQLDLRFGIDMRRPPPHAQTIELSLGVIVRVLGLLGEGQLRPAGVLLPHSRLASATTYRDTYGCVCLFEQPHAAVRVHSSALARPLPQNDPTLRKLAQSYLDTRFSRPDHAFADKVRQLVRDYLSAGLASHQPIADMLAVHVRTMQRRLGDEGTSFERIKDELRRDVFEQLLTSGGALQLSQVAAMLDYANQAALTRSCRRWFGVAPSAFQASRGQPIATRRLGPR